MVRILLGVVKLGTERFPSDLTEKQTIIEVLITNFSK